MSEIKVDKISGRQVTSGVGPEIVFAANGNFTYNGTADFTGTLTYNGTFAPGGLVLPNFTTANLPASPATGSLAFDTDLASLVIYNGTEWVAAGSGGGADGSAADQAVDSVADLYTAGQSADGFYWININGTPTEFFVPLSSHPGYVVIASWNSGANVFMPAANRITGNELRPGTNTPTGNWGLSGTYGYYRNTSANSDFKYASFTNQGFNYRYVKFRFNLYIYYSNDGVNGRSFLSMGGVGDGATLMRDNSGAGNSQHIFTYYAAINNNDGNDCPSGGTQPTHQDSGNNPSSFLGNRYTCFTRQSGGFTTDYTRNFTTISGDTAGNAPINSTYSGDAWYEIDLGATYSDNFHMVIHSDQSSSNEDTYIKRGCVMVKL